MWSDSEQQYSQWALNPSAYQNVSHDNVDWAALAQQWIQMKDTCPADQMPPAPPPPPLGRPAEKIKDADIEGGEAPMDMDRDDVHNSSSQEGPAWGAWNNNWQQQWGGGNTWGWGAGGAPPGGVPPPSPASIIAKQSETLPIPGYGYSTATPGFIPPATGFNYAQATAPGGNEFNQVMVGGYWTAGPHGNANAGGMGPAPFIRNNRQEWSKRNNRSHERNRSAEASDDEDDSMLSLDAAKRRQLPAWIREGLEKMEREKQKKMDRDRQVKEREIYLLKKKEEEEIMLTEMQNNSGQPMIPKKSKFESDSEESDAGDAHSPTPLNASSKRRSRFRNADSPSSSPRRVVKEPTPEPEIPKSREEKMQEIMLNVRRMLTEVLLEVTTEQMESIAVEELTKAKAKAPAMALQKTPALASLTGKLGLGIYGDSDDESGDSGDDSDACQTSINGGDSDQELKDLIQRRKAEFSKTEREIEARLREEEEKEKERERRMRGEASDGGDSGGEERQVEHNQTDNRHFAPDGIKIKSEPEEKPRFLQHVKHEDIPFLSNKDFHPPAVRKEIKCELLTGHRSDSKGKRQVADLQQEVKIKVEKRGSSDENDETSSKSDSESSSNSESTSSAVKTSSSESKRSSKKSKKNGRSRESTKKSSRRRKRSDSSEERKVKKRDSKLSSRSKDKKRDRSGKDARTKDRKKEKRERSRSRSKESHRSKRSRSRESRRSKSDRRNSDTHSRRSSDSRRRHSDDKRKSHKSRDSEISDRTSRKSRDSYSTEKSSRSTRESRPSLKLKKSSSVKRLRRDSTSSRSPSVSGRGRADKRGKYSHSRSSSPAPVIKKSKRRDRSASSERSSRATGKTLAH